MKNKKGFTLVEVLVVVGILAILMTIAIVAIDPFKQFAQANNVNRWSGINTIMNSISQRIIAEKGKLNYDVPLFAVTNCPATGDDVPTTATVFGSGTGEYNLCAALVPTYVGSLPYDPQNGSYTDCSTFDTGYNISCSATNKRITIEAPDAQNGEIIKLTR
jgi:prepilin-type N-terminal cleavage/methylation domain-containing protein